MLLDSKDWVDLPQDPTNPPPFFQQDVLSSVRKQIAAANGTPIEWVLPEATRAELVAQILERELEAAELAQITITLYEFS